MKYLIDTNICIYLMNRRSGKVLDRFRQTKPGDIGISTITISELQYGASTSAKPGRNRDRINDFLVPFEVLSYDDTAASRYGSIRAQLEKEGRPIGPIDLFIAAHALSLNLILITNNEKEFTRVRGLKVENWVK